MKQKVLKCNIYISQGSTLKKALHISDARLQRRESVAILQRALEGFL